MALLQTLSIEHPDALDFISIKKKNVGYTGELLSTNISMYVTDRFMENYINKTKYRADYYVEDTGETIKHTVDPQILMDSIIDIPEKAFDPALVFVDRFKDYHFFGGSDNTNKMSQNGCNEMIGIDGATCLLATMVVEKYVVNRFKEDSFFDFHKFKEDVYDVIQEMDVIIDEGIDRNPLEKQRDVAREWRNLGLGITSLADCLISLGIKYGSDEAVEFTETLTKNMQEACICSSKDIAKEKGQSDTILNMEREMELNNIPFIKGLRNASLMAHAPSGTGSTMMGMSTGIEPIFRKKYVRSVTKDGVRGDVEDFVVYHNHVKRLLDANGDIDCCVDTSEISAIGKVKMLASIQKSTDMCSSNTTNFKKGTTVEEIKEMYIEAWKRGVTSMSIYVDGSLDGVLNEVGAKKDNLNVSERGVMSDVPSDTLYIPKKISHGCGSAKIMIGFSESEKKITDVYLVPKSKSGCTKNITGEAILISQILRLGGNLEDIKSSIDGIDTCVSCSVAKVTGRKVDGRNCPNILIDTIINTERELVSNKEPIVSAEIEIPSCASGS